MTMSLLEMALVMYAAAVAVLWTATRILAPAESRYSILRCFGAAVAMTVFGNASRKSLSPLIGDWYVLVSLLAYILVVKAIFRLAFWRCILVAVIYIAAVGAVYYFLSRGLHTDFTA